MHISTSLLEKTVLTTNPLAIHPTLGVGVVTPAELNTRVDRANWGKAPWGYSLSPFGLVWLAVW